MFGFLDGACCNVAFSERSPSGNDGPFNELALSPHAPNPHTTSHITTTTKQNIPCLTQKESWPTGKRCWDRRERTRPHCREARGRCPRLLTEGRMLLWDGRHLSMASSQESKTVGLFRFGCTLDILLFTSADA